MVVAHNPSPKLYDIILADPPWRYDNMMNNDPARGGIGYSTMTIEELCDLPIRRMASRNAHLFLWTTFPKLEQAFSLFSAWGFRYITCAFVWIKLNPSGAIEESGRDLILKGGIYSGLGHWTNGNAELCLLGKRGSPPRVERNVKQIIIAPRSTHSAKPHETYGRILRLLGDKPRIELFARHSEPGWDVVGDGVGTTDIASWMKEQGYYA